MKGAGIEYTLFRDAECKECYGCTKRTEGCHSTCTDYQASQLVLDILRIDHYKKQKVVEAYTYKAKRKHPSTRYVRHRKER